MSISAMKQAYAVPLIEQLESVPADARMMYEHDKSHHENIPVGRLCHEAATALRQSIAEVEKQEQKTPLKVLGLTVFTENRLRNGRVYDVETLQAMNNRDILAIPGMGKKALKEVLEALHVYASDISQERVDEIAKHGHELVGQPDLARVGEVGVWGDKWVGLTDEERKAFSYFVNWEMLDQIEAKLKEKNNG